jgi:hypothetical protein
VELLFFFLAAAAAEFGAGDEKVGREDQRGEREEDKAAMGFLMMPTYITGEVSKVQRRVLNPLPRLIRIPSVFYAIYIQNAKFLTGKLFSRLHCVMVFVMQNLVSRPCAPSTKKEKAKKTHVHPFCVTLQTLHPIMCHKVWIPYHQITRGRA